MLVELSQLFNSVIHSDTTLEAWSRSVVVLFLKKGNKSLLKNYHLISLLSHVYKFFPRVITNCRPKIRRLPTRGAGCLSKGFQHWVPHTHIKANHLDDREIQLASLPIETRLRKTFRYHRNLSCPGIHAKMPRRLQICPSTAMSVRSRIDNRPSTKTDTRPVPLHRGVRQGDIISTKLFTNATKNTVVAGADDC